jgi:hypothetical protein
MAESGLTHASFTEVALALSKTGAAKLGIQSVKGTPGRHSAAAIGR